MQQLSPTDVKSILLSKRANLYFLERCRVLVHGGRVEYVTDQGKQSLYWNIPIANTTVVLLGGGTSITQAAMRELAKAGVVVGFCGSGGTPLFAAGEIDVEVLWQTPQSEYRPTEYLRAWVRFWFDDAARLEAARQLQRARLARVRSEWRATRGWNDALFNLPAAQLDEVLAASTLAIERCRDVMELLTEEARVSKQLYRLAALATNYGEFNRAKRGSGTDPANRLLDHGNYLAYGLAASATWVLGLPHGLAVLHGKTRRGGLVFDAADLVKDASILPQAFISAVRGDDEQAFRQACIEQLTRSEALDFMIDTLKSIALQGGKPIAAAGVPASPATP